MRVASMVLAIIAFVLGLPGAICSGACAEGISAAAGEHSEGIGNFYMAVGMIAAFLALIGGLLEVRRPKAGAIVLLVAFLFMALSAFTMNPLAIVNALLLLLATLFGFLAKPPESKATQPG